MKSIFAKVASVVAVLAFALAIAGSASAQSAASFTRYLTVGSNGADVVQLQTVLESQGYLVIPAGTAKGHFGPLTKSAVAKWQAAVGLPATGYFGPLSVAKINASMMAGGSSLPAGCSSTAGFSTTTGASCSATSLSTVPGCSSLMGYSPTNGQKCDASSTSGSTSGSGSTSLQGGEGNISEFKITGSGDDIREGSKGEAISFQFKADSSDLLLDRADILIQAQNLNNGSASNDPWRYIDSISIERDGKVLKTVDGSTKDAYSRETTNKGSFSNSGDTYRLRISNINNVVKQGDKAMYTVNFTAQSNIDSINSGQTFRVAIDDSGIRTVDAKGIDQYEGSAGDDTSVSFSESSTGTVSVRSNDTDAGNSDMTVSVNRTDTTNDVSLLSFSIKGKDAAVNIRTIPVSFATTSGGTSTLPNIIRTVRLYANGKQVDSESVSSTATGTAVISFSNLNLDIAKDATVDFVVKADIKGQQGSYNQGVSVKATLTGSSISAENSDNGRNVTLTGSATGGVIKFRTEGLNLTSSSNSATVYDPNSNVSGDALGKYVLDLKVQAFDEDVFVPLTSNRGASTTAGVVYTIQDNAGNTVTTGTTSPSVARVSGGTEVTDTNGVTYAKISDGQTATLELNVSYDPATAGQYRLQLGSVNFAIGSAGVPTATETASPIENFRTSYADIQG